MHLHELLKMSIQDYELERNRIEMLFFRTPIDDNTLIERTFYPSLAKFVDEEFAQTKVCGTATGVDDFFKSCVRYWNSPSLESLLFYCEIVWNVIVACEKRIRLFKPAVLVANQIFRNVTIILDKTGHEIRKRPDRTFEILKKDALASVVTEDLSDADTAMAVLEYNHFEMKGNVAKKRELLVTIGRYVEPLTDHVEMKGAHSGLVDDVRFCLNNLHIRHNNEEGKFAKDWLEKMSGEELESWYDKAYRSMLLLIEEHKHLETHRQINALKKQGKI